MTNKPEAGYHYTACGLDDVYLVNLPSAVDHGGDNTVTIKNANRLHVFLQVQVALKPTPLVAQEVKFLRTALSMTQAELARNLHKDSQTVGRWERGDTAIDGSSETLLRILALQGTSATATVQEIAQRVMRAPQPYTYRVDASDPEDYRAAA